MPFDFGARAFFSHFIMEIRSHFLNIQRRRDSVTEVLFSCHYFPLNLAGFHDQVITFRLDWVVRGCGRFDENFFWCYKLKSNYSTMNVSKYKTDGKEVTRVIFSHSCHIYFFIIWNCHNIFQPYTGRVVHSQSWNFEIKRMTFFPLILSDSARLKRKRLLNIHEKF